MQWLALALLGAVTAGLCYLALTRDTDTTGDLVRDDETPSGSPSASTSATPPADPSAPTAADVPEVPDQRRADFTAGDDLPDGARLVDIGDNETGMALGEGGLTHGGPGDGGGPTSDQLKTDVSALGIRVRFAEDSRARSRWSAGARRWPRRSPTRPSARQRHAPGRLARGGGCRSSTARRTSWPPAPTTPSPARR